MNSLRLVTYGLLIAVAGGAHAAGDPTMDFSSLKARTPAAKSTSTKVQPKSRKTEIRNLPAEMQNVEYHYSQGSTGKRAPAGIKGLPPEMRNPAQAETKPIANKKKPKAASATSPL